MRHSDSKFSKKQSFPALGVKSKEFIPLNLSIRNSFLKAVLDESFDDLTSYRKAMEGWIFQQFDANQGQIGVGGYGETRGLYDKSPYFVASGSPRNVHLGVDLWSLVETPVYAAFEAKVHSTAINNELLDYGGTVILEYSIDGSSMFCLYGHLSHASIDKKPGTIIQQGEIIGWLGNPDENGGWPPHLHLQLIRDMGDWVGDFPGVATKETAAELLERCPDPSLWLRF